MDDCQWLKQPLLTCIGNKRKLAPAIAEVVADVAEGKKLVVVDLCTGSGVVGRHLLPLSSTLYLNDLEAYSYTMAKSIFQKPLEEDIPILLHHYSIIASLQEKGPWVEGIISNQYSPQDTLNIKEGERCFYTRENALILDTLTAYIFSSIPSHLQHYFLAPLLVKASIHTNTSGVFKGFYKKDGVGCFGGKGGDALGRIMGKIKIELPIWNKDEKDTVVHCSQQDALTFLSSLPDRAADLIYFDPPYTAAPYASNYFMLNLLLSQDTTTPTSKVSGIPTTWNRSPYNYKKSALEEIKKVLETGLKKSRYILISYSNEGIVTEEEWRELLSSYTVVKKGVSYDTFKGCRNRKEREGKVEEVLYLVKNLEC